MQISPTAKLKIKDNIISKDLESAKIILNLETGYYFTLNEMASWIWPLIESENNIKGIIDDICANYNVDADMVCADVNELVNELLENKIVDVVE